MINDQTIVALATPNGTGAIGVIRLSGPEAITIVNSVFKGKDLIQQVSHTIHFGNIVDGDLVLDEVLMHRCLLPQSHTPGRMSWKFPVMVRLISLNPSSNW